MKTTEAELQQLRIAVAEAEGWTKIHPFDRFHEGKFHRDGEIVGDKGGITKTVIPFYLTDRNAIIVRRFVTDEEQGEFGMHLSRIIQPHGNLNFCAVASTAEQLCRAYLAAAGIPATP